MFFKSTNGNFFPRRNVSSGSYKQIESSSKDDLGKTSTVGEATPSADGALSSPLKSFKLPSKEDTMTKRIEDGDVNEDGVFPWVTITGNDGQSKKTIQNILMSNFRRARPELYSTGIMKPINLTEDFQSIPLSSLVPKKWCMKKTGWVAIRSLRLEFTPASSYTSVFCDLEMKIVDKRFTNPVDARWAKVPSHLWSGSYWSMDYSIHMRDIDNLHFICSLSKTPFYIGISWGSVVMELQLEKTQGARVYAFEGAQSTVGIPAEALKDRKVNPMGVNLTMDDNDLEAMKDMKKSGQLKDLSQPLNRQVKHDTSKSDIGSETSNEQRNRDDRMRQVENWNSHLQVIDEGHPLLPNRGKGLEMKNIPGPISYAKSAFKKSFGKKKQVEVDVSDNDSMDQNSVHSRADSVISAADSTMTATENALRETIYEAEGMPDLILPGGRRIQYPLVEQKALLNNPKPNTSSGPEFLAYVNNRKKMMREFKEKINVYQVYADDIDVEHVERGAEIANIASTSSSTFVPAKSVSFGNLSISDPII
uniref:Movement protein n=1 Tax=Lentinula edodes negative-strand RNA virus 3 TaxID=2778987 RepID=A0A7S6Z343_9VIRU|nr:movement protein [Lentinula edodes negative-strand RNA virus 3]